MKQKFVTKDLRAETLTTVLRANEIIGIYQAQGLRLTLRQLYYQFVVRNWIVNSEKSYKNLGRVLSDGRLAGLIDWDSIEDRVRIPVQPPEWSDLNALVRSAIRAYRRPRWAGQDYYVELWVEKDALSGVLQPLASEYHVTLMVNRGYSSQSAMYDSAMRRFAHHQDQTCVLFYLGDHDPSGEDMVRDIGDRLNETFGTKVDVQKIALTMDQVRQYNPPPNPAKMSDSRAAKYVNEHGDESWEVDALPPNVLTQLIRDAIEDVLDSDAMDAIKRQEELDKTRLIEAAKLLTNGSTPSPREQADCKDLYDALVRCNSFLAQLREDGFVPDGQVDELSVILKIVDEALTYGAEKAS